MFDHKPDDKVVEPQIICHDSPCIICESRKVASDDKIVQNRFRDYVALQQFKRYGRVSIHGGETDDSTG